VARIDGDSANTAAIVAQGVTVSNNYTTLSSGLVSEASTRASAVTTVANDLVALNSTVTSNNATLTAAVSNEAATRATAVGAVATDVTTLFTSVGGHTASLTALNTSVDGLKVKAGVLTNVDGNIVGWELNNGLSGGDFNILTPHFRLIDPSGVAPTVTMEVVGGVLYAPNLWIGNLVTNTVTTPTVVVGAISDYLVGTSLGAVAADAESDNTVQGIALTKTTVAGAQTRVSVSFECTTQIGSSGSGTGVVRLQVRRNGVAIKTIKAPLATVGTNAVSWSGPITLTCVDNPPAGDNEYSLWLVGFARSISQKTVNVSGRDWTIEIEQYKR
jgi:hypothetical protein